MPDIRDEGPGPLGGIADRVAAKEIGKLWNVVQGMRGYAGQTAASVATSDQLTTVEKSLAARIDRIERESVRVPVGGSGSGSSSTIINNAGEDLRPLDNQWTGDNRWQPTAAPASYMKYDTAQAHMIALRDDALPISVYPYEAGNFFADTVYRGANSISVVPMHMHGTSADNHVGNVWGFATEAYNDGSKQGKASPTQLFGGELSIINKVWDSTASRHAGALIVFKNRMDGELAPLKGSPPGNRSYNKSASAIYIDSSTRGSVTSIQSGWYRGIYFAPWSLDSSNGNIGGADNGKSVGIDMGDLEGFAPEGGRYYQRLNAAIALPPNTGISWDGSTKSVQTRFNNSTGNHEWRLGNTTAAGINHSTGILYQGPTAGALPGYYLNLGSTGDQVFEMLSSSKMGVGFVSGYTLVNFFRIKIDGGQYYVPIYTKP